MDDYWQLADPAADDHDDDDASSASSADDDHHDHDDDASSASASAFSALLDGAMDHVARGVHDLCVAERQFLVAGQLRRGSHIVVWRDAAVRSGERRLPRGGHLRRDV